MNDHFWVAMINFRSADLVLSCLESLRNEHISGVMVVDNNSGDEDWAMLQVASARTYDFEVQLASNDANVGFGAGVNAAAKMIQAREPGAAIWVLNPDIVVEAGAVQALKNELRKGSFDVLSPVVLQDKSDAVWFASGELDSRRGASRHLGFGELHVLREETIESTFVSGAAVLFGSSAWSRLGGFREDLFLYWEDADLSMRAAQLGMRIGVVQNARVWHLEGGSGERGGHSVAYYYYMQRNRLIVFSPFVSRWSLLFGRGAFETMRMLVRPVRERTGRWSKLHASISGIYAGLR